MRELSVEEDLRSHALVEVLPSQTQMESCQPVARKERSDDPPIGASVSPKPCPSSAQGLSGEGRLVHGSNLFGTRS